jgi:hypothetical protein
MVNHEALLSKMHSTVRSYISNCMEIYYFHYVQITLCTDIHMPEIYSMGLCKIKKKFTVT